MKERKGKKNLIEFHAHAKKKWRAFFFAAATQQKTCLPLLGRGSSTCFPIGPWDWSMLTTDCYLSHARHIENLVTTRVGMPRSHLQIR